MTLKECKSCGREYKRISAHWRSNNSHVTDIEESKMEVFIGLLMGDGSIRSEDGWPYFRLVSTNKKYIEWLRGELGWVIRAVDDRGSYGNRKKSYELRTMTHPDFEKLKKWYSSGKKSFPDNLQLNKTIVKHWYCCDGGLEWDGDEYCRIKIKSYMERFNESKLKNMFNGIGFYPNISTEGGIYFSGSSTESFLSSLGDPIPGFEYKWEYQNRDIYEELMEEAYS